MHIKGSHIVAGMNVLTLLLAVIIVFFPNNVLRIALGLPLVLFFPGYVLLAALFPRKRSLGNIERLTLSFGMSIAIVSLIGLALNYTTMGIRLYPILISTTVFIMLFSVLAGLRNMRMPKEEKSLVFIPLPSWSNKSIPDKILMVVLILATFGAIGTAAYAIAMPKAGETFTEFYIVGSNGKAENYPTDLVLGDTCRVTLGIINHEGVKTNYRVVVRIDGELNNAIGPIILGTEEKDETIVSFVPQKKGNSQKVELFLYKNGLTDAYLELHFWLNVANTSG